jgi:hypothetical protein
MFFLGMSHTCFACRLSNEPHEKMKAEKSIGKASKNQQKHTVSVRREDIKAVTRAIHGDGFGACK